jgi:sugar phosphate isomerase/epimerase
MDSSTYSIGFSMHPRWLSGTDLAGFLKPLRACGLGALELLLDPAQPEWAKFDPLARAAVAQGMRLSFHAPYARSFALAGFSGEQRGRLASLFRPLFLLAEEWTGADASPAVVVVHGARGQNASRESLRADTQAFLEWALENFPRLRFALENVGPAQDGEEKIGQTHAEVLELVEAVGHWRLSACWDLGHDLLHGRSADPEPEWLARVGHAHVHDLDERGVDHFPLMYGRVPAAAWLSALRQTGHPLTVCLEIKGHQLSGWSPAEITGLLTRSISTIREAINP